MDITELLAFSAKQGASDLHLSAGLPPMIRLRFDQTATGNLGNQVPVLTSSRWVFPGTLRFYFSVSDEFLLNSAKCTRRSLNESSKNLSPQEGEGVACWSTGVMECREKKNKEVKEIMRWVTKHFSWARVWNWDLYFQYSITPILHHSSKQYLFTCPCPRPPDFFLTSRSVGAPRTIGQKFFDIQGTTLYNPATNTNKRFFIIHLLNERS